MRRILCLFITSLLLCSSALADTITVDLDNASIEDLQAARTLIDKRIAELTQLVYQIDDSYVISGAGTEIREVNVSLVPLSRFVFSCADGDAEYTITVNGEDQKWISEAGYFETEALISRLMVQAQAPWTIDVSPIGNIDTPYISGTGNYVSDCFTIDSPSIVSVIFDYTAGGGNYWNEPCSLLLYMIDVNGNVHTDYLISNEDVYEGKTITVDAIIDVDEDITRCFWGIKCNGRIKWSLSSK